MIFPLFPNAYHQSYLEMTPICFILMLFKYANDELENFSEWFKANKLWPNAGKTKCILFHKLRDNNNLRLQLPNLRTDNYEIKRSSSIKFLSVLVDENLEQTLQKLRTTM